jgi:hypothetical protein
MSFYMKRNEDRHTERQRVRERVSASVGQRRGSVGRHSQTTWVETHLLMIIISRHL